jgi:membrane peptidoglycan carboxypeptidase
MSESLRERVVVGFVLFGVVAAAAGIGLAILYGGAVARLRPAPSLDDRGVRVLARPISLGVGHRIPKATVEQYLQRIGYYQTAASVHAAGCYSTDKDSVSIWGRFEFPTVTIRWSQDAISHLTGPSGQALTDATLEPETLVTLADPLGTGSIRLTSQRPVSVAALAGTPVLDAIVASEDRLFFTHHGVDLLRLLAVPFIGGGASTITGQLARTNLLHDRSRTLTRKLKEIGLAMAIERVYSKETILSSYLNTVDVGASHGRELQGFGAASLELFGVADLRQLTALQAATLAALLNQPSRYLAEIRAGNDRLLRRQRNRVLHLMARAFPTRYPTTMIEALERQPVAFASPSSPEGGVEGARYALDYAAPSLARMTQRRAYLTIDADLQRAAVAAVSNGLTEIRRQVSDTTGAQVQAALVAVDRTGRVLAMVGGRSYEESQFNRAVSATRQVGSILKPFVYLAAFEKAADEGRVDVTGATQVVDEPTTFNFPGRGPWAPTNYRQDYAGQITWHRALAESRNVPAVKVAAWAGFDRVTQMWERASGHHVRESVPAIALGAAEATPLEVATAYTIFLNGGVVRPLRIVEEALAPGREAPLALSESRRVARAETTQMVTEMLRAVLDEGTGRAARKAGFLLPAAGKTGTTENLRDAWFVGFTPDLLTVVWVGRDDDLPVGLTGGQAALPIWVDFMKSALADRPGGNPPILGSPRSSARSGR